MNHAAQQRTVAWFQAHPNVLRYLDELNRNAVRWALYSGAQVYLLTGRRNPNDLDIVVDAADLAKVRRMSPKNAVQKQADGVFVCGDGTVLDFPENGLSFTLDDVVVDVMATGEAVTDDHAYHLSLSGLSLAHRQELGVGGTTIYFAHPFDTVALKAILQRGRGRGKHDLADCRALLLCGAATCAYADERASEIGLDDRVWAFLDRATPRLKLAQ